VTQPVDEQLAVLGQVVGALRSLGVSRMVSGSIAASFYVEPRMTRDLDIVVDLTPDTAVGLAGPTTLAIGPAGSASVTCWWKSPHE
jgi:hypothetical protein